jgi:hypothetical protein
MYEFSIGSFVVGLILAALSLLFVKNSHKIADMFGGSYSRYQIYAFVALGISVLIMFNIQDLIAKALASTFFSADVGQ